MTEVDSSFRFRMSVELWGSDYRNFHAWGRCEVTPETITVSTPSREHVHRPKDLVELRWWCWGLGASLVAISKDPRGKPLRSRIGVYLWGPLRSALRVSEYRFTTETYGFSLLGLIHLGNGTPDVSRYGLMYPFRRGRRS